MALPPLTPYQRAAALEKAAKARKDRAEVKNNLKRGAITLPSVLKQGQSDDTVGKLKVSWLSSVMAGVAAWRGAHRMVSTPIPYATSMPCATPVSSKRAPLE